MASLYWTWETRMVRDSLLKESSVGNNKRWKVMDFHKWKCNEVNNVQRLILLEKLAKECIQMIGVIASKYSVYIQRLYKVIFF